MGKRRSTAPRIEPNWLLAGLSDRAYGRVSDISEIAPVHLKEVLITPGMPVAYAYFPQSGCLSMIALLKRGTGVEVGTIGWEGMAGVSLIHGADTVPTQCVVQVAGSVKRITRDAFEGELRVSAELRGVINSYAQVWADQIGQGAACNGAHSIEQRLARWLLITADRVEADVVPLSQEFLSIMLAVRRAGVTVAALALQQAGLIDYKRAKITVVDRVGLEGTACECYVAMREMYSARLPVPDTTRRARLVA
jgi:CRP-like cAMP-binding protein